LSYGEAKWKQQLTEYIGGAYTAGSFFYLFREELIEHGY